MEGLEWFRKLRKSVRGKGNTKPNPNWPEWYQKYFSDLPAKKKTDALLIDTSVVVIDAETTGLDLKKDRLLSLGGLRVQGNSIQLNHHFEAYLPTPADLQDLSAVPIHGILPNSNRYTYTEENKLLSDFLTFVGDRIIVGHHIGFDVEILNRALERQGGGKLQNQVLDTAKLAERLHPVGYWTPRDQFSLDKLARRYRIPLSDRHTALGDAYITAVLWLKLTARLQEKVKRELVLDDL